MPLILLRLADPLDDGRLAPDVARLRACVRADRNH
jgi:hypothetical protein